ncbi:radical SAM-associated putative lipoprotein [Parabacteroides chongii]|uniref:radical SAM-associated putative lipoprotein n=1 Tax=Parabacteroides chongii TaxID=2685834 RepID=UPI00240D465E|nr:radical SAM-associated putative lipoprotein [Parabacteroides chongii]WFE85448.1 radical SAM-associated putative lipoprotein [Parabacteroides chongii]
MNKTNHFFLTFTNKMLAGLLSLLGFSLAACDKIGTVEYGCPHADYTIKGKVVNNQGDPIPDIQIEIRDSIPESAWAHSDTVYSDSNGEFLWKKGDFPGMTYQLISKDIDEEENGGKFATNNSYVSFRNADFKGGGTWYEGAATMETKITLTPYVDTHKVPHALYTIHGQVTGDDGYPIAGIVISSSPSLLSNVPDKISDYLAITNGNGMYSFTCDLETIEEYTIETELLKGYWNSNPYEMKSEMINFAEIELSGGKGMLIGKGSKEVNFTLKRK